VHLVFMADIGWDERQVVNGLSEFRGHASRSNGREANSGGGERNLPRTIGPIGFLRIAMADLWRPVRRAIRLRI
jgi:hypothetical protein